MLRYYKEENFNADLNQNQFKIDFCLYLFMNFLDKGKKFTYNNNGAREQEDKEIS